MKTALPLVLILGINLAAMRHSGAETPEGAGIPLGERLVYKITWLGIHVATGNVWVKKEKVQVRGREAFHIVGRIETSPVLRKIFPMRDSIQSWIDAQTLESLQFEKDLHALTKKTHELYVFDTAKKMGQYKSFTTGLQKEFSITTPVQDVLSAFYWIRRQNLAPGKSFKTVLSVNRENWHLTAKVLKQETVKFQGKKIETLSIEPETLVEGKPKLGRMQMNVTMDPSRTPVRVTFKAPFGNVVGKLQTREQ
jgi:hypothetical protein